MTALREPRCFQADSILGRPADLNNQASASGLAEIAGSPKVRAHLAQLLASFAALATGSSNRIARAMLIGDLPSVDSGEITDKDSLNQRAILKSRTAEIAALYIDPPPPDVIDVASAQ